MNKKSVKIFKILGTSSLLLMILASIIATLKGIYLIWLMPIIWLFAYVFFFYICQFVQSRPEKSLRHRLIIQIGGILLPNSMLSDEQLRQIRDFLAQIPLIGVTVFGNVFAILVLVGMITQK